MEIWYLFIYRIYEGKREERDSYLMFTKYVKEVFFIVVYVIGCLIEIKYYMNFLRCFCYYLLWFMFRIVFFYMGWRYFLIMIIYICYFIIGKNVFMNVIWFLKNVYYVLLYIEVYD